MSRFSLTDLPDLTGRTAVVTGSNSGIGVVTARALAERGARVVLAVLDPEKKGEAAAATMAGPVQVRTLDLAEASPVRSICWSTTRVSPWGRSPGPRTDSSCSSGPTTWATSP